MLLHIGWEAFSERSGVDEGEAIEFALLAARLGHHRVVVSPEATVAAAAFEVDGRILEQLLIAQRGWLEGQSLLNQVSRVLSLVADPSQDGMVRGNRFHVHVARARIAGLFHQPCLVTESLLADAPLLKLFLAMSLSMGERELDKVWAVRPEQGGGGATFALISRYGANPEPMMVACDRDTPAGPACGETANRCIRELLGGQHYSGRAVALSGGFADLRPNLSFRVLGARSLENLIFPKVMELYLSELTGRARAPKEAAITAEFAEFPNIGSGGDAARWLGTNLKRFSDDEVTIIDSAGIARFVEWARESEPNYQAASAAFHASMEVREFREVMTPLLKDLWTVSAAFPPPVRRPPNR